MTNFLIVITKGFIEQAHTEKNFISGHYKYIYIYEQANNIAR